MAANNAQFDIIINAVGHLEKAIKELRAVGSETDKVNKRTKEANKAQDEFNYRLNQGVVGTASAGRSMSKLAQTIGSGPNGLVGAYATLAANAFAVSAAFNTLKTAEQAQLMLQGLEAQSARTGRTLTLTAKSIQEITQNSLSAADALRATSQASSAGISSEDIERLTKVATNASKALGRDIPDSINRMIMAVTKMEPELVDELGLTTKMTQASEEYARQVGKTANSLTQLEKQQALLNAWASQGEVKFGNLADSVDPNPYNQLAASFTNLTNTILNFANNAGILSFVKLLSEDTYALAAGMIFFLNTVKGQLLPALTGAASVAKKISDARLEELNTQKAQIKALKEETLARKANELAKLKESLTTSTPSPKKYQEWVDAVRSGEDAVNKEASALRSLEISKGAAIAKARAAEAAGDTEAAERFRKRVADREAEIEAFKRYGSEAIKIQDDISKADEQYTSLQRQARITRLEGKAQEARAAAITSATELKLGAAFKEVIASAKYYQLSLIASATGTATLGAEAGIAAAELSLLQKALIGAKTATFGLVTGVKAVGVAILEWLPYIGLAVLAWDGLMAAIDFLTPESVKKKKEAFEAYSEVLASTQQKLKGLAEIEASGAGLSDKYTAALQNRFNTLAELTDAYTKFNDAALETVNVEQAAQKTEVLNEQLAGTLNTALQFGVAAGTVQYFWDQWTNSTKEAAGVDLGSLTDSIFKITPASSEAEKALAGTFQTIEKLAPETTKQFDKMQGGLANIKDEAKRKEVIENFFRTIGTASKSAVSAVDALSKSIQALNNSYADFINSIKPSTPYDKLSDSLNDVSKNLEKAKASISSGAFESEDAKKFLAQISAASSSIGRGMLSIDTASLVDQAGVLDNRLQSVKNSLKNIATDSEQYKATQREIVALETERDKILSRVSVLAEKDLNAYAKRVETAQLENITLQGTLAIAQARLNVIQRQGVITAQDVEKQINAQNQIIQIQAQMLRAQAEFARLELQKKQNELDTLVNRGKELDLLLKINDQERSILLTKLKSQRFGLDSYRLSQQEKTQLDTQISQLQDSSRLRKDIADNAVATQAAEKARNLQAAALEAIEKNIKAILMGQIGQAEKLAAMARTTLKNEEERLNIQRATQDIKRSAVQAERQIFNILSLQAQNLEFQLKTIEENARAKLKAAREENQLKIKSYEIELALAKALGNNSQITYYESLIKLTKEKQQQTERDIEAQRQLEILNQVAIKDIEEFTSVKRGALDIQQRILDATREEVDARQALFEITTDLDAKRRGVTDTAATQTIKEIKAAEENLKLVTAEAAIKMELINLEFALLKAKKLQSQQDLDTRIKALQDLKSETEDNKIKALVKALKEESTPTSLDSSGAIVVSGSGARDEVKRLTEQSKAYDNQIARLTEVSNLLKSISETDLDKASDGLKNAIKSATDAASARVDLAKEQGPLVLGGLVSQGADMRQRQTAREASGVSATSILGVSTTVLQEMDAYISKIQEGLKALGPEGEVVLAVATAAQSIGASFVDAFKTMADSAATSTERTVAALQAVSAVVAGLASILKATSDAKISNIDKEISAEEKRDGKSSESLEKIKAMEKRKDDIARKSFNTQKKLMMAQAVINTASGVTMALGTLPPPASFILAGIIGAMGAAQLAIISGTQYDSALGSRGSSSNIPTSVSIGKRDNSVDLAKGPNANAGGEVGYLRGSAGTGTDASNYRTIGSAYGGELMRGYGNRGFVVGEKGPEVLTPETPITVTPANDTQSSQSINATINIQALDSGGVQDILVAQKGNIIKMLREAANASGKTFMEDVNVNVYTRPSVGKL